MAASYEPRRSATTTAAAGSLGQAVEAGGRTIKVATRV